MQLLRIGQPGQERPVASLDGKTYYDISSLTPDINPDFFAGGGVAIVRENLTSCPVTDISGERIGAPVAKPGVVLCIGMNYAAHAAETGAQPPKNIVVFYKAPVTVVGPNDVVKIPRNSTRTDWEVELAVVIGSRVSYLNSPEEALAHVAGYTISNDVSERHFQMEISGGQWSKGKSCETFNPLGPYVLTADEVPDPQDLRLALRINGEARQDSSTADMIFSVAQIIYDLSQVTVLEPGDIINTGTPQGVAISGKYPYLSAGDVMEVTIEKLGAQRQETQNA